MLEQILAFTLTVRDLAASERAYASCLDFRSVARGTVSPAQAAAWAAPGVAGRPWTLLEAAGQRPARLRLVEQPPVPGYRTLASLGWAAVEILVGDPYALAVRLEGSPFTVVVPPRPIPYDPDIHAMQVMGPDGEMLYLTRLPHDRVILDLHASTHTVDRAFIAILAARSLERSLRFYAGPLGTPASPGQPTLVKIVNDTYALDTDHRIPLGVVKLPRDFVIEVDEYPPSATSRPRSAGLLPPGIAMVTFAMRGPPSSDLAWIAPPAHVQDGPCAGNLAGVIAGPDGEWLELSRAAHE